MDLPAWKNKVHERLQAFASQVNKNTPGLLYGALAATTLLPVVTAANQGDFGALVALTSVVGGVGGNLIANQLQTWKDRSDQALADELATKAQDPEWRQALDALLREGGCEIFWVEAMIGGRVRRLGQAVVGIWVMVLTRATHASQRDATCQALLVMGPAAGA